MQPIHTALLSFGMSGKLFHAPFLAAHPGFVLTAAWERSKSEAVQFYPSITTHRTLEDVLADDRIELVVVNTPNYTHFDYAQKALQAGKHVVMEKPFTATVAEGEALVQLAKSQNRLLIPFQNRRWDSDFRTFQQVVRSGVLGEVVEAELHFDRFSAGLSAKAHKEAAGAGTGVLYDLGTHLIDQALCLFGRPNALFADLRMLRSGSVVDDYFELLLYYPRLRVRLHASYFVKEVLPSFMAHGTHGSFVKLRADPQEKDLQNGLQPNREEWGREEAATAGWLHVETAAGTQRNPVDTLQGNYLHFFDGVYEALRKGAAPPVLSADALANIRLVEAAKESSRAQKVVTLSWH